MHHHHLTRGALARFAFQAAAWAGAVAAWPPPLRQGRSQEGVAASTMPSQNPNDFDPPDMAAKRRELELLEDLPAENAMRFGLFTLPLFPGTTLR
eukprot:COSAG01_NODE_8849_length_2638_cov_1.501772_3_plen_94_part_01